MHTVTSRRGFLRLSVATAAVGALSTGPLRPVLAADGPVLYFPQDPLVTSFSSTFGAPRPGGRRHKGNDLMAPKLSPVFAAADGIVTIVSDGPASGRYLVIEHADGWSTWYMHLNNDEPGADRGRADWAVTLAVGVDVGTTVSRGQQVAFSGDSGNAEWTGPHTHFELHRDGRAINPFHYLKDAYERAISTLRAEEVSAQVDALCRPDPRGHQVDGEICSPPLGALPEPILGIPETA